MPKLKEPNWIQKLFVFRTNKVVEVYHVPLGVTYYTLMLSVIFYVAFFQIYKGGGYQLCEQAVGTVNGVVKGSTVGPRGHVWDAVLLRRPGIENNALFLTTRAVLTIGQTEGECIGKTSNSTCVAGRRDCKKGQYRDNGKVVEDGCFTDDEKKLDPEKDKGKEGHCKLRAWCPIESDSGASSFEVDNLNEVGNFSVFIRAAAKFPEHGAHLTNVKGKEKPTPGKNVWQLHELLAMTERAVEGGGGGTDMSEEFKKETSSSENPARFKQGIKQTNLKKKKDEKKDGKEDGGEKTEKDSSISKEEDHFDDVNKKKKVVRQRKDKDGKLLPLSFEEVKDDGAVIIMTVHWACNLDDDPEKDCEPEYKLQRVDRPDSFAHGFNWYEVAMRSEAGPGGKKGAKLVRDLFHNYGIRILFQTTGTGCKFDFATLTVNVGAGLALVVVAAVITDLLLQYLPWCGDGYYVMNQAQEKYSVQGKKKGTLKESFYNMKIEEAHLVKDEDEKRKFIPKDLIIAEVDVDADAAKDK